MSDDFDMDVLRALCGEAAQCTAEVDGDAARELTVRLNQAWRGEDPTGCVAAARSAGEGAVTAEDIEFMRDVRKHFTSATVHERCDRILATYAALAEKTAEVERLTEEVRIGNAAAEELSRVVFNLRAQLARFRSDTMGPLDEWWTVAEDGYPAGIAFRTKGQAEIAAQQYVDGGAMVVTVEPMVRVTRSAGEGAGTLTSIADRLEERFTCDSAVVRGAWNRVELSAMATELRKLAALTTARQMDVAEWERRIRAEERERCAADFLERMSQDPESAVAAEMSRLATLADVERVVEGLGGDTPNLQLWKPAVLAAIRALREAK